jgi:MFS family permease
MKRSLVKAETESTWRIVPRGVCVLGLVSMFMDVSSEMIHALLPIYLVDVLGASMTTVGLIEGIAEATATITKAFSGILSDWLNRRKLLVALGYGLAAFTKPLFPLATTVTWVISARFIDRIGKGIREAPRDALIADLTPVNVRGASFGLRQSLDTIGAFAGPALAISLMLLSANSYRLVFWVAVIPAFVAFALIVFGVHDSQQKPKPNNEKRRFHVSDVKQFSAGFWVVVGSASVLALARFSDAFLILDAKHVGITSALSPTVMVAMNMTYAMISYPVGALSDRIGRFGILLGGLGVLITADLVLAFATTVPMVFLGVIFWGIYMGLTQGLLSTLVADTAPKELRGTAYGIFGLATGISTLLASVLAGQLWNSFGPQVTFLVGVSFSAISFLGFLVAWNYIVPENKPVDGSFE